MKTYPISEVTAKDLEDYPKALAAALEELRAGEKRPVSVWIDALLEKGHVRLRDGFVPCPAGEYALDLGDLIRGKSPDEAYASLPGNAYALTTLQFVRLLAQYPDIAGSGSYVDFCADQAYWVGLGWVFSLYFYWHDGQLHFSLGYADCAHGRFAAGVALLSGVAGDSGLGDSVPGTFDDSVSEITLNGRRYRLVGLEEKDK